MLVSLVQNIVYEQITETPVLNVGMTDKKMQSPFSESLSMNFNNLLAKYLLLLNLQRPGSNSVCVRSSVLGKCLAPIPTTRSLLVLILNI